MAVDLATQLRAYAEQLNDKAPPLEELIPPRPLLAAAPRPVRKRPQWLPALVTGLVVLLVVGGVGLLSTTPAEPIGSYGPPPAFRATIERRIPSEAVATELAAIAEEQLQPPPEGTPPDRVMTLQLSYDGADGWRLDFLSDSFPMPGRPEESAGSFWVTNGEQALLYSAETNTATDAAQLLSPLNLLSWDGTPTAQDFWSNQCSDPTVLADEQVAGRRAHHAGCGDLELWVDAETGLVLRLRLASVASVAVPVHRPLGVMPGETLEVTELEHQPTFPEETFQLAAPPGAEPAGEDIPQGLTRFVVGEQSPTWTAPLLSGGELDLASLRGKPVALLFWASWCPPCLEDAAVAEEAGGDAPFAPFENAYEDLQDEVNFVSVAYEDDPEIVRETVEQTGHQIPVVLLTPGTAGEGWVIMAVPTLIFLDEDGRFLGGSTGVVPAADIARAIDALAAGEPLPDLFRPETGQWP